MQETQFSQGLLDFLRASPTPFHAVENMQQLLEQHEFRRLEEDTLWAMHPGRYYVTRNGSSLIAFIYGRASPTQTGIRIVGAHTDSPCLKIKPQPEISRNGYLQLGVEVYGGALLNPWFDRDLSIAGRVTYVTEQQAVKNALIDFRDPVAVIPSLAIHLDRDANSSRTINAQKDLPPLLMQMQGEQKADFRAILLEQLLRQKPGCAAQAILDYELSLYDAQPPALVGLKQEFIAGARLDNLLSCYVGLVSLLEAGEDLSCLLVCNDHEEVGSTSACGAQGPFLRSILERKVGSGEALARTLCRSLMISADNAHGVHPNFADKHDANHQPLLNGGPVIKVNHNQRYATNSETAALFRHICQQAQAPVQSFVMRSDLACGSTLGPITASAVGVRTVDVGVPTLAMHSIRELAGSRDAWYLHQGLCEFFRQESVVPAV